MNGMTLLIIVMHISNTKLKLQIIRVILSNFNFDQLWRGRFKKDVCNALWGSLFLFLNNDGQQWSVLPFYHYHFII